MSLPQSTTSDDLHARGTDQLSPSSDPVIEEVRALRDAYARSLGYDPDAIVADLQARQAEHSQRLVELAPKPLDD